MVAIRDRIKELRRVKASELRPNPKNWRSHPQAQQDALRGVLAEVGYADALLARELPDGSLTLIDGHLRAATTPDVEVPVLILDLTEAEADKVLATLDPLAAMAEANKEALGELLAGIETDSEGVGKMLAELAAGEGIDLFADGAETPDPEPQIDRADELLKKWKVEPGQLWEMPGKAGVHRVLCGDSTKAEDIEKLMGGRLGHLVITDPPYGVDIQEHDLQQAEVRGRRKDKAGVENDNLTGDELRAFLESVFANVLAVTQKGYCWYVCAPPGTDYRHPLNILAEKGVARHGLVWVKDRFVMGRCDYHYRHENIIYGWTPGAAHHAVPSRDQDSVWECVRPGRSPEHPTVKPVELCARGIANSSAKGDIILDPFLGSGTTLIAAEQLGRVCYGIEIAPKYVAVILQRAEDAGLTPKVQT